MDTHLEFQKTKDGRFHVHTNMYLLGAILKEEMDRSVDVLAAGYLRSLTHPFLIIFLFARFDRKLRSTYYHLLFSRSFHL
ncbi:hypothetical protein L1987_70336 [Smallanthus sonchifolius]|uniref:Uncharacterized protein n=1 Tax=Smallanthus sonchifolius TaxID=185202 RepID=A0ACB9ATM8_9ASTR|nr:hypothetical protein L1987_70336 [Smallanthus sonchifolius]